MMQEVIADMIDKRTVVRKRCPIVQETARLIIS
ncbi:hypothetical protein L246_01845 [Salmonella enterica subsp. enterica serovar Worthington str. BCH-5715]|nr:hypothetical protein L246_01845 [Salmonella enterica subsp. enterica serovar Worthington str. BCH-5715]